MDIFKYNPTGEQTVLEGGEIINGITRKLWVEKYSEPGEFTFEAPLSSGIMDKLPEGTLLSQVSSLEVMIVESLNIKQTGDEEPFVVVTGRTFPSYLEQRIVTSPTAWISPPINSYTLAADKSWLQIMELINNHIISGGDSPTSDELTGVSTQTTDYIGLSGTEEIDRVIKPGTVLARVQELLAVDDFGIRTQRPWFSGNTFIEIYNGSDLTNEVIFSHADGDLDSAEYLFTQKSDKNAALVVGTYIWLIVTTPGLDKYDRRYMLVDATDVDGFIGEVPSGAGLVFTQAVLAQRGREALRNQNKNKIVQADISASTRYRYRRDYNVGDLVKVNGNFGAMSIMRVTEFAEVEDENGYSGHPTLALPLPEDS